MFLLWQANDQFVPCVERLPFQVYLIAKLTDPTPTYAPRSGRLSIHRLQLTDTLDINAC